VDFAIQKLHASMQTRVVPGIFIGHVRIRLDKNVALLIEAVGDLKMPRAGHPILLVCRYDTSGSMPVQFFELPPVFFPAMQLARTWLFSLREVMLRRLPFSSNKQQ
jgi:hypothetical protein